MTSRSRGARIGSSQSTIASAPSPREEQVARVDVGVTRRRARAAARGARRRRAPGDRARAAARSRCAMSGGADCARSARSAPAKRVGVWRRIIAASASGKRDVVDPAQRAAEREPVRVGELDVEPVAPFARTGTPRARARRARRSAGRRASAIGATTSRDPRPREKRGQSARAISAKRPRRSFANHSLPSDARTRRPAASVSMPWESGSSCSASIANSRCSAARRTASGSSGFGMGRRS